MNQDIKKSPKVIHPGLFGTLNPQKVVVLILRNWYVYLMALIIAFAGSVLYLKYKIPSYISSTTILIEEEDNMPAEDLLQGISLRPGVQNLDNQLIIISSYSLINSVIQDLSYEIDVYRKGFLSKMSYFPMSPLRIEAGDEGLPYHIEFLFQHVEGDQFHLSTKTKRVPQLDSLFTFGKPIQYEGHSFTIFPQPELAYIYQTGDKIFIKFRDDETLTNQYIERMEVNLAARDGSIVRLSLEGTNKTKDVVFLNKLSEIYIGDNLDKKNTEADRIIAFIDSQLEGVKDSLEITETELQEFRSRNRVMDVSAQAQQIVDQAVVLENERAQLNLQKNYYEYLNRYLNREGNDKAPVSPSSMGIEDFMLTSLMQELAGLQAEYFSSAVGERNPLQGQL
ncbi:MAG: hypothetical protein U9R49_04600, partial [Bacteroidota bacterium]|nr:hypothetical protein [Bacteroidota bacterium]